MFIIVKTIDYTYDSPTNEVALCDTFKEVLSFLEEERRNLTFATDVEFEYSELFEMASLSYCHTKSHAKVYYKSIKINPNLKNKFQKRF